MREKILKKNKISFISFFLSSFSLFGIPFLNLNDEISIFGYVVAVIFWLGLLTGIVMQFSIAMIARKTKVNRTYKERRALLLAVVFLILFILIRCFFEKSIVLMSIDIAFLLFSSEMYFYLKWRYSI